MATTMRTLKKQRFRGSDGADGGGQKEPAFRVGKGLASKAYRVALPLVINQLRNQK